MIRLIISVAMLAGMAACASSAPPAAAPGPDNSVTATNAGSEAVASADEGAIEAVEAPQVALTTPPEPEPRDEMVCHRERLTGSHRFEKICRLRSDIDKTREETHDVLRRMDRQSSASSPSN